MPTEESGLPLWPLVDVVVHDDAQYADVVRRWLGAVRTLAPNLWQRHEQTPAPAVVERDETYTPWDQIGPPGGAFARLAVVQRRPSNPAASRACSEAGWAWLDGELAGRPVRVAAILKALDSQGCANDGELWLAVETADDEPDRLQLTAFCRVNDPDADARSPVFLRRWFSLIAEVAGVAEPVFGYLGGFPQFGSTELDVSLHRLPDDSVAQGRELLRGFSWLTMVPAALAERLGGSAGLRSSGAFVRVDELPDGAVLLVATDTPAEYDDAAVHRVFNALAPVLPADALEAMQRATDY